MLAVIIGIGSTIFGQFTSGFNNPPTISDALTLILAALSLLGLTIFGPGIANGLIAGGPQLGWAPLSATCGRRDRCGWHCGDGRWFCGRWRGDRRHGSGGRHGGWRRDSRLSRGWRGWRRSGGGIGSADPLRRAASSLKESFASGERAVMRGGGTAPAGGGAGSSGTSDSPPAWAQRMKRSQTINRGVTAADHAIRSGDRPSGGSQVDLSEGE